MATSGTHKKKKILSSRLGSALAVFENTTKANQEHNARDTVIKSGNKRFWNIRKKRKGTNKLLGNANDAKRGNDENANEIPVVEVTVKTPKNSDDDGPKGGVQDIQRKSCQKEQTCFQSCG